MWTEAHRDRHHPRRKEAVSDRMAEVPAAWIELVGPPGSPLATVTAAVMPAIPGGWAWRERPPGSPNWRTVDGRFRRWTDPGLFEGSMRHAARRRREARGRMPPPTLATPLRHRGHATRAVHLREGTAGLRRGEEGHGTNASRSSARTAHSRGRARRVTAAPSASARRCRESAEPPRNIGTKGASARGRADRPTRGQPPGRRGALGVGGRC